MVAPNCNPSKGEAEAGSEIMLGLSFIMRPHLKNVSEQKELNAEGGKASLSKSSVYYVRHISNKLQPLPEIFEE